MIIERAIAATRRAISRRSVSRTVVVALFATLLQVISGSLTPASAVGTPVVTMPAGGWVISQNATTTISGASVSGLGSSDVYLITIALTGSISTAKLALPTTTGITASYGYTSGSNILSSFTKISFTGTGANVNAALAAMQYIAGTAATTGTTPTITISAVENVTGLAFNPTNGHYYKAVKYTDATKPSDNAHSTAMTWSQTQSFAGQNGYLVTITSSDENSFVASTIPSASNIWIGARDNWSGVGYTFGEGYWGWASPGSPEYGAGFSRDVDQVTIDANGRWVSSGTLSPSVTKTSNNGSITSTGSGGASSNGYSNWCASEPNNVNGEHMAVTNWSGGTCWNDLPDSYGSVEGLVIEWGTNATGGGFTNAVSASAKVYLAPTIARLSANNQIAQVSTAYPNSAGVQLVDAMGTAIPNATITWTTSRGTKLSDTSTTNVNGITSQLQWTMPSTTGIDTLTATYSGAGNPTVSYTARVSNYPKSNTDTDTAITTSGTKYASISNSNSLIPGTVSTVSLEAWIKPSTTCDGAVACTIMTIDKSFLVQVVSGKIRYYIGSGAAWCDGNAATNPAAALTPGGQWTHVGFVRVNANVKIYINGVLRSDVTSSCSPTTQAANTNAFVIGAKGLNSEPFVGSIDEVRIWNVDRTSNIASDMHSNETSTSGLLNYWNFNEGSGAIVFNQVPSATLSSDLTITDSTMWDWAVVSDQINSAPYSTRFFYRSYITANGGWKVPSTVSTASTLVIAGGGGGGSRVGGGGGAGGFAYIPKVVFTPNSVELIQVGQGGSGAQRPTIDEWRGQNGQSSFLGTKVRTVGGGGGGGYDTTANNVEHDGKSGGSGGGASAYSTSGGTGTPGSATQVSTYGYGSGNSGGSGSGQGDYPAGGGGGAGGAGSSPANNSTAAAGGAGIVDPIGGTNLCYAAGGGGGIGLGASGAGGAGGSCGAGTTTTASAGTKGRVIPADATPNSGSGGGGAGYQTGSTADVAGGSGGSGIIIIRWITALLPSYTKPVNAYLNVGMTETFTTNVMSDSATVGLTRTFRWESTTGGANGTFTLIKQGTGAANAAFSWIPTDTSTSGSNYLYRLIVTDSDTAGLFITDSSTAFAVINRTLVMTGVSIIKKAINVSRTDTYTVTFGTPSYRVTLTPVISGITLDTSTITSPVIRIADTATVGTYYETLTVTDSVSANVVIPLTITISAPPNLLNTAEIISDNLVFNLDAGNSASLISESGTVTTALTWNDLSGSKANATTGSGVNTGGLNGTSCSAPTYTSNNGGALTFASASTNCYYASGFSGKSLINNYTVEAWFKTSATLPNSAGIVGQSTPSVTVPVSIFIINYSSSGLVVGFYDHVNSVERYANCPYVPTIGAWTHIAGTYDGTTLTTYINGASRCTETASWTPNSTTNSLGMMIGKGPGGGSDTAFPGSIASIRMYNKPLTAAQILSNFNATKFRFDSSNDVAIVPTKKYGASAIETFTVTSGSDTRTITFSIGDRNGIDWDTSTVANQVKLTLQESLTVGAYLDTVTVTDALGQSTYLPFRMTTTKADTLTVTMSASTTITYNGSALTVYPRPTITGLKWTDTATTVSRFSSILYSETTTVPINADTYTVRGSVPTFTIGSLDNYLGIIYDTATATINKANQKPLNIYMYGGTVGTPYLIWLQGGSGTGAVNETLTGVATLTGCAISNHYLTAAEQKQGYCEVRVVKDGDQNYWSETQTVQMYFMAYINGQPTGVIGSGNGIGINGVTSYIVDTTTPPSITGLSTLTLSIAGGGTFVITGTGFGASGLTVKFWRNKVVTPTGSTSTTITFNVSDIGAAGATTGRVTVITVNGQDFSTDTLTITP